MLAGSAETFALPDEVVVIVGYLDGKEVRRTQLQANMLAKLLTLAAAIFVSASGTNRLAAVLANVLVLAASQLCEILQ